MSSRSGRSAPTPAQSLREYGRGLAGGLIFSLPLLYTMELWWAGIIAGPGRLMAYLGAIFILLLGYNRYAGLRQDASPQEVVIDSVEELGLGIVTAAGVLFLLGRIGPDQAAEEIIGKVLIEAGIVAVGFSVGTAQLGGDDEGDSGFAGRDDPSHASRGVVIAACGAVLFAAHVAPTEEILMIAIETSPARLFGLAAASMGLAALVLYYSDFVRARTHVRFETPGDVAMGTVVTYGIALLISAAILWFFGRFDGTSLDVGLRQTVVLGFPAVLGASAGRLLLQS